MLKRFSENFDTIFNFSKENNHKIYNQIISINHNRLKKYVEILSHFNDATEELSFNIEPTIQKVIPIKNGLKKACEIKKIQMK